MWCNIFLSCFTEPVPHDETCWPQPRWPKQVGARRMMIKMPDITLLLNTQPIRRIHELIMCLRPLLLILVFRNPCLKAIEEFRSSKHYLPILLLGILQINIELYFTTTLCCRLTLLIWISKLKFGSVITCVSVGRVQWFSLMTWSTFKHKIE